MERTYFPPPPSKRYKINTLHTYGNLHKNTDERHNGGGTWLQSQHATDVPIGYLYRIVLQGQRFSNHVGSCSHMYREKTEQSNEIHLFNSTINMAVSIAERHNLNTLFKGRGKSVWLVCTFVMCSCSTA
jgi:hypothetical protein